MPVKSLYHSLIFSSFLLLNACYQPPFNDFNRDMRPVGPSSISPITARAAIIQKLRRESIQFVKYGDQYTLIIPTDKYYEFNSPHLNEICYPGLADIIELIKTYSYDKIYVAAFTDNVGSELHKDRLSNARAETMLTFLWAYNIPAEKLMAEGYGDEHPIGSNQFIHSSAYNRRIEIQWTQGIKAVHKINPIRTPRKKVADIMMTK